VDNLYVSRNFQIYKRNKVEKKKEKKRRVDEWIIPLLVHTSINKRPRDDTCQKRRSAFLPFDEFDSIQRKSICNCTHEFSVLREI